MTTSHIAKFQVDPALLADALCLPKGTTIHGIGADHMTGNFVFIVESSDLPQVDDREEPPEIQPTLTIIDPELMPEKWLKFDWGIDNEDS